MADFEDANSPTWANMIEGQINLRRRDRAARSTFTGAGRPAATARTTKSATLLVRPRGWHLPEKHLLVDGAPVAACAVRLRAVLLPQRAASRLERGSGPYFYLPKLESHLEARLWNDVFVHAQDALGIPRGTIKATVLIETCSAAFEMDEILYELREHSAGLNAGRWDYMFSTIKKFRQRPEFLLPDRDAGHDDRPVHARLHRAAGQDLPPARRLRDGRHGGVHPEPERCRDQRGGAGARSRDDKRRESSDGFDGTWVAHPDSGAGRDGGVRRVLGERPNQIERQRDDVDVTRRRSCSTCACRAAR